MCARLLLLAVLLAGCGGGDRPLVVEGKSTVESGPPCAPASPVDAPAPADLPELPVGSVLTAVGPGTVTGRVEQPLRHVVTELKAAFDRAGYVVQREQDEGRAVQLAFFGTAGTATLAVAELTCPSGSTGFTLVVRSATG